MACCFGDEPTEGIQPSIIKHIGEVLRRLIGDRQMAIVLVEQYVDFVREFGDSFMIMNRGRIVHRGKASELHAGTVQEYLSVVKNSPENLSGNRGGICRSVTTHNEPC